MVIDNIFISGSGSLVPILYYYDNTHMQEGIAGPIGKLYEAESLVGVVPFYYGLDRRTGGRFKSLGPKLRSRSETAPGWFEVVIVEATVTGRAKISVSAGHLSP
jgi:hypothetical protein